MASGPILAIDTASAVVSVAVARSDRVLAARTGAQRESSAHLLGWIDEALREAGVGLSDLEGAVALRGPGSFTGLRVGLATLLGFHQAIGLAATALPTLQVLAAAVPGGGRVVALVPAGPGEWFAQCHESTWPPRALEEPRRLPAAALVDLEADSWVVGSEEERARLGDIVGAVEVSGPLAAVAARLAVRHPPAWDATLLRAPLYLAPPPVTVPGPPKAVLPLAQPRPGRRR